jgi:hypothetical protein
VRHGRPAQRHRSRRCWRSLGRWQVVRRLAQRGPLNEAERAPIGAKGNEHHLRSETRLRTGRAKVLGRLGAVRRWRQQVCLAASR